MILGITSSSVFAIDINCDAIIDFGSYSHAIPVREGIAIKLHATGSCNTSGNHSATSTWTPGYVRIKGERHAMLSSGGCRYVSSFDTDIYPDTASYNGTIPLSPSGTPQYTLAHIVFAHVCLEMNADEGLDVIKTYTVGILPG